MPLVNKASKFHEIGYINHIVYAIRINNLRAVFNVTCAKFYSLNVQLGQALSAEHINSNCPTKKPKMVDFTNSSQIVNMSDSQLMQYYWLIPRCII